MSENNNEPDPRHWRNWISAGDLLTATGLLVAMSIGWGSISKDVETLRDDIADLKAQRISAGAAEAIAGINQRDQAQDRELAELKAELREQRREIMEALNRVETELKAHDRGR